MKTLVTPFLLTATIALGACTRALNMVYGTASQHACFSRQKPCSKPWFADLVSGARNASPGGRFIAGLVRVYHGSAMGLQMVPARVIEGVNALDSFGSPVAMIGNGNGDAFREIVLSARFASPGGRMDAGNVMVFCGSAMGVAMVPSLGLDGSQPSDQFGFSFASLGLHDGVAERVERVEGFCCTRVKRSTVWDIVNK